MVGVSALMRRDIGEGISLSLSLPCEDSQKRGGLKTREKALTRTQPGWYWDLGLPSIQNFGKCASVV